MCYNTVLQVMPGHIACGYKKPQVGAALFMSYLMDEPIQGEYTIYGGRPNKIVFRNGWENFCNLNQIEDGSLLCVRVEMRVNCIGLFVQKIR